MSPHFAKLSHNFSFSCAYCQTQPQAPTSIGAELVLIPNLTSQPKKCNSLTSRSCKQFSRISLECKGWSMSGEPQPERISKDGLSVNWALTLLSIKTQDKTRQDLYVNNQDKRRLIIINWFKPRPRTCEAVIFLEIQD